MKKVKVKVVSHGSMIQFKNNGIVAQAPVNAVIQGYTSEANVMINSAGLVTILYSVTIKNPNGGNINAKVNDLYITNNPSEMEYEVNAIFTKMSYINDKGIAVEGAARNVYVKNAYNQVCKAEYEVEDEYHQFHRNCVEADKAVTQVWGL